MVKKPTLLVASSTRTVDQNLVASLAAEGYRVSSIEGTLAILAHLQTVDLLILQIYATNDLDLIRAIRYQSQCAIIVIGPARTPHLLINALEAGADDYIARPSHLEELLARIRARIRRLSSTPPPLRLGRLWVDQRTRRALHDGQDIELEPAAFSVLLALANAPNRHQRPEMLLACAPDSPCDQLALEQIIQRLRSLIEPDPRNPHILFGDARHGYWLAS